MSTFHRINQSESINDVQVNLFLFSMSMANLWAPWDHGTSGFVDMCFRKSLKLPLIRGLSNVPRLSREKKSFGLCKQIDERYIHTHLS